MAANMALLINDDYIVFNVIYAYHSCMLGEGYFANPGYAVVML